MPVEPRNSNDLGTPQVTLRAVRGSVAELNRGSAELAHTIRHLGDVHAEQLHWSEADRCFVEALCIYRNHSSPGALDLANAIRANAALKTAMG